MERLWGPRKDWSMAAVAWSVRVTSAGCAHVSYGVVVGTGEEGGEGERERGREGEREGGREGETDRQTERRGREGRDRQTGRQI